METEDNFFETMCHKNSVWFYALQDEETVIEFSSNCGVVCDLVKESIERDPIPYIYINR